MFNIVCKRASQPPRGSRLYHLNLFKQAKTHAERVAVVNKDGRKFTYSNLLNDSNYVSNLLASKTQGGTVSFLCPSDYCYVVTQWAIWRSGCIAVPLCYTHPKTEMEYTVTNSESKILVISDSELERATPLAQEHGLELLVLHEKEFPSYEKPTETCYEDENFGEDDYIDKPALIIYTSGTTGPPKGVVLRHRNIETMVTTLCTEWAWTKDDRIPLLLPLHHIHGIVNVLTCAMWSGATCEMMNFTTRGVWDRIMSDPPLTLFMAVPTIYEAYKELPPELQQKATECSKAMRLMVSGSMALPQPTFDQWLKITGHRLLERYGMTEIGMALTNPLNPPENRLPGYIGKPFPSVQVKIKPEEDDPNFGELLVKGPQVFREYYNLPEATKKAFDDEGWFFTGDVVRYDPERRIYKIEGRSSVDILKSAGYKISALDIERELLSHPDIVEAVVIGITDETWGQLICAVCVAKKDIKIDQHELGEWLKARLAHYKLPRKYAWVDTIPRNAMGKVNKKFLTKWWLETQETK